MRATPRAQSCISSSASVSRGIARACSMASHAAALAIQQRLQPLHEALFMEASPSAVKYAASLLDLCGPAVRLPLVEPLAATKTRVEAAMRSCGVLN
ncbi:MAG: dihydrodipicolinate synthase family protein [Proteobacteria bacterium]|nr:dihydrodipicolinate synthase family protein [Pseudomonadota bacterium]